MKKYVVSRVALVGILFSTLWFSSCMDSQEPDDANARLQNEIAQIDEYLNLYSLDAVKDPSGIRMVIDELGTGLPARTTATVVDVNYKGRLFPDGTIFDNGPDLRLALQSLVAGWRIALQRLPVGSKATLFIPSYWGYATQAQNGIPANSILQFDIEFNEAVLTTTEKNQLKTDTTAIDTYLDTKGIVGYDRDSLGLRYTITNPGVGPHATWYDRVNFTISYKLLTNDASVVYSGEQTPTDAAPSRPVDYIQGIMIALQKLGTNGKGTFYIPSGYCFGTAGANNASGTQVVPPNANLIVDVEVHSITPQ